MKKKLLAILSLLTICGLFAFYIKAILFEKEFLSLLSFETDV